MSLTVRMRGKAWRLAIKNEEWEFKNKKDLKKVFDDLLRFKEEYGDIMLCAEVKITTSTCKM